MLGPRDTRKAAARPAPIWGVRALNSPNACDHRHAQPPRLLQLSGRWRAARKVRVRFTHRPFSDFTRVVFELFRDEVPKTVEKWVPSSLWLLSLTLFSFRALATGEKGLSQVSQTPLYYKGCIIHRSIENFMIQGGGMFVRSSLDSNSPAQTLQNATAPVANRSTATPSRTKTLIAMSTPKGMPPPSYLPHRTHPTRHRLLVMANRGPNTNSSQFFITVRPCPHLNGKHVVFGEALSSLITIFPSLPRSSISRH